MIASLRLPDDHYDEGSAGDAVARTLAQAMKSSPEEIDDIIQRSTVSLSSDERRVIFRVYTELLWRRWNATPISITAAEKLALDRIVQIFTQRPSDERLGDAAAFLRSHAADYPDLLEIHVSTLLGAAALISTDLEHPYSFLLDPRPDGLKILESQTREISLNSALEVVTEVIGVAAARKPHMIGKEVVQTLAGLGDTHDRLKAALVFAMELYHFLQILAGLGRVAGQSLQDNLFRGVWSEQKFQEEVKKLLRADARIGSELEEHPHAGGGITDLSFHQIRIELKVEPEQSVTVSVVQKYCGQTTQYVAGSDRRFGIVCLLDCFPKKTASGSVANDIDLLNVPPPGNPNGIPIFVGVVVVRGNLSKPSDLSKEAFISWSRGRVGLSSRNTARRFVMRNCIQAA
jgi:hypothetical protein